MKIAKWGNSFAIRLPRDLVERLGLREGDEVTLRGAGKDLALSRLKRPDEVLEDLRRFRGRLPAAEWLSRDAANER